ncbi:hypothetical protein MRB53_015598 [Persea americana]|uniref:Uncharacterized protein n=1 Tax=Persea americana TaxID=3435 RepID=A0ACC2LZN6_PERAE|nr:hypothetical protein MRB53_015598 [Persea americana]
MASSLSLLWLLLLLLLQNTPSSNANLHKTKLFKSLDFSLQHPPSTKPTNTTPMKFFEVSRPIKHPHTKPCSSLVLKYDFAATLYKPPVTAPYNPPTNCASQNFSKIILQWKATCKGRQFDRIFGVWLGGAELLRSCTAEPTATGIFWNVEKDITRYSSLLKTPQTLSVYLGNIVDDTYTGIYHVEVWFHFYPEEETHKDSRPKLANSGFGFDTHADLILPISRNPPLNDGLWFQVNNNTDSQTKEFEIPRNVYRAVLEVYVSFHGDDEFWFGNPPEDYVIANNLTDDPGNGPFREVVVNLDDKVVGAIWPFTVVYTGGINPLLWRPITGIGSFDLPSYDIEITPFLGEILDGKSHKFRFAVTNSLSVWFVDANLHLWLDGESEKTEGKLIKYSSWPLSLSLVSNFEGLNGKFLTKANRSIYSVGWVKSSQGNITASSMQMFDFENSMEFEEDGNVQVVNQNIDAQYDVFSYQESSTHPSSPIYTQLSQNFPFYMHSKNVDQGNSSFSSFANVSLGFSEAQIRGPKVISLVTNNQSGQGQMLVKGNLVQKGLGSTQQDYNYFSTEGCYFRNVSSKNYTIIHDKRGKKCFQHLKPDSISKFHKKLPLLARGALLASDMNKQEDGN